MKDLANFVNFLTLCPWTPAGGSSPLQPPAGAPSEPVPLFSPNQNPGPANVRIVKLKEAILGIFFVIASISRRKNNENCPLLGNRQWYSSLLSKYLLEIQNCKFTCITICKIREFIRLAMGNCPPPKMRGLMVNLIPFLSHKPASFFIFL